MIPSENTLLKDRLEKGLRGVVSIIRSSFGRVVVAKRKTDRWPVAIKIVPMDVDVSSISKEAETLKACNSMFIVGYQGVYNKGKELWVRTGGGGEE